MPKEMHLSPTRWLFIYWFTNAWRFKLKSNSYNIYTTIIHRKKCVFLSLVYKIEFNGGGVNIVRKCDIIIYVTFMAFYCLATFFLSPFFSPIFYIIHSRYSLFLHFYQAQKWNIFESRRHVFFLFINMSHIFPNLVTPISAFSLTPSPLSSQLSP